MDGTLYNLVIDNIDFSKLPDMSHFQWVYLKGHRLSIMRAYKKLKVPDEILSENEQAFQDAQMSDPKLEIIWRRVSLGGWYKGSWFE